MGWMKVRTPSRIHISLIDLNGGIGRVDGGVGLALEQPGFLFSAEKAESLTVTGRQSKRARDAAERMLSYLRASHGVNLDVMEAYDAHLGLGSGTQLMLGVGKTISELYGMDISTRRLAQIMGRGGTSGIGTAVFESGGFILDGGHSTNEKTGFLPSAASKAKPAPVLLRHDFPDWKIALLIPEGEQIHGMREVEIFKKYCPIPIEEVRKLSHLLLMKLTPSVVENDISTFGEGINEIQNIGFKRIEVSLQSKKVRELLKKCQKHSYGAGLSSFGPTIYSLIDDEDDFHDALQGSGKIIITKAHNSGAMTERKD